VLQGAREHSFKPSNPKRASWNKYEAPVAASRPSSAKVKAHPTRRSDSIQAQDALGRAPGPSRRGLQRLIGHRRIVEADLWDRAHLDLCRPGRLSTTAQGAGLEVEYV
jgi:hypothetical protein